jgi:hypothetical protein
MTPVTIILFAVIVVVLIIDYILNKRKNTAIEDTIKKLTTGQSEEVIKETKQKLDFDILLSRIIRIVTLVVILFGITFFIACKSFIPRYYFNKGNEPSRYVGYGFKKESKNFSKFGSISYSLSYIEDQAAKKDMSTDEFIRRANMVEFKNEKIVDQAYFYNKANQYWMIFSNQYYPGTKQLMEKKPTKPHPDFIGF